MIDLETLYNSRVLGLGCSTFGGSNSRKTALHALEHAYSKGIIYYDLARSYGYGQAESIFGEFAKSRRDKIIITTKFGILPPPNIPFRNLITSGIRGLRKMIPGTGTSFKGISNATLQRGHFTPEFAETSLEKSLKELKTDYIDIFLLHECTASDVLKDDVLYMLEKAIEKGKIRKWGGTFSNTPDYGQLLNREVKSPVMQVPFRMNSSYEEVIGSSNLTVTYSVMNYCRSLEKAAQVSILDEIKREFPSLDFIKNLNELFLFLAFNNIHAGVILCSMTKESHINRNIEITSIQPAEVPMVFQLKRLLVGKIGA